jgi:hypothetical protein
MRRARKEVEEAIERLITLLDNLDGDENLEEGGDLEPETDTTCEDHAFDDAEPGPWNPHGCHIFGGGSGI